MSVDPIDGVTREVIDVIFDGAPTDPFGEWFGELYRLPDEREVLPFVFHAIRFIAVFTRPVLEAGGDEEFFLNQLNEWAQGFVPDKSARLVKFCRAELNDRSTAFKPDEWQLDDGKDIFGFAELLRDIFVYHSGLMPPVNQYFYMPASDRVASLYKRIFRRIDKLLPGVFQPILTPIGDFHGYQRHHPRRF